MSFMDKVKSFFSGGSAAGTDEHAGHDHSGHDHDHSHEAPMPPADPMGAPMAEPTPDEGEDRPA